MSLSDKLEKSAIIDLLTVIVLSYDVYLLYIGLGWEQDEVLTVSGNPQIIAVQITLLLILIYALEFVFDKFVGGGDDMGLH